MSEYAPGYGLADDLLAADAGAADDVGAGYGPEAGLPGGGLGWSEVGDLDLGAHLDAFLGEYELIGQQSDEGELWSRFLSDLGYADEPQVADAPDLDGTAQLSGLWSGEAGVEGYAAA